MGNDELKNLKIDPQLHHQLKMRAAAEQTTIRELVEAAVRLFLDNQLPYLPDMQGEEDELSKV